MQDPELIAQQAEQDQLWAGVVAMYEDQYELVTRIMNTITGGNTAEKIRNAPDDILDAVAPLASMALSEVGIRVMARPDDDDSP